MRMADARSRGSERPNTSDHTRAQMARSRADSRLSPRSDESRTDVNRPGPLSPAEPGMRRSLRLGGSALPGASFVQELPAATQHVTQHESDRVRSGNPERPPDSEGASSDRSEGGVDSVATAKSGPRRANDRPHGTGTEVQVQSKPSPDVHPPSCTQTTVRGDQCTHRATWAETRKRSGEQEFYCTRHANIYMPWRRGGERV
jgi:hypothetical protein